MDLLNNVFPAEVALVRLQLNKHSNSPSYFRHVHPLLEQQFTFADVSYSTACRYKSVEHDVLVVRGKIRAKPNAPGKIIPLKELFQVLLCCISINAN